MAVTVMVMVMVMAVTVMVGVMGGTGSRAPFLVPFLFVRRKLLRVLATLFIAVLPALDIVFRSRRVAKSALVLPEEVLSSSRRFRDVVARRRDIGEVQDVVLFFRPQHALLEGKDLQMVVHRAALKRTQAVHKVLKALLEGPLLQAATAPDTRVGARDCPVRL